MLLQKNEIQFIMIIINFLRLYMNIHFYTLGCKVNQYETQAMREALIKKGHTSDDGKNADGVIINSCTVTAESDRKTRQLVNKIRRNNPGAVILLTGCMVQAFPESAKALGGVDIIIGNRDINKVIEAIDKYQNNKYFNVEKHLKGDIYNTPMISAFEERTRAFMKIEDGCDRFCSYCIIPTARGRVRSRTIEDIKNEAQLLSSNGYVEIVLVGINLSAYGFGTEYNLCDAVEAVCSIDGIKRVRLGSLEPDHITDEMLERLKAQEKFCPQFHLSLQSGCDATLKRMNRHYDSAFYFDLIERIRKIFPDASITTDIMVGFAGETEEEFEQSILFAKKAKFARAHIFAYSRREGTVAAALKSQVTKVEKERRSKLMISATKASEKEFLKSQVGATFPVLFEKCENGICEGYTPNYSRVRVISNDINNGEIINILITDVFEDYCIGEIN